LGFTVILNATDVINIAQGEFVVLGGILTVVLVTSLSIPIAVAVVLSVLLVATLGAVTFLAVIRPVLRVASPMTLTLITLALSFLIASVALYVWGPDPHHILAIGSGSPLQVFGAAISPAILVILGLSVTVMMLLTVFYNRTKWGQAMLACNVDQTMASLVGINVEPMVFASFVIGAALAGFAGAILVPLTSMTVFMGLSFTLKGFAAAVFGGLGKGFGAVLGGLSLGLLESFGAGMVSSGFKNAFALGVILIVLLVRPSGILGSRLENVYDTV
jgi:branched-chain amino acid transport system permease protein